MKYKVGDRVKIKSLDWYNRNKDNYGAIYAGNGFYFWKNMSRHCGEIMKITIVKVDPEDSNKGYYFMENSEEKWTDEMIEGLVEEESKFGTALNPIEPKSNANCLTRKRVDELATRIDKELPSGNQYVWELPEGYQFTDENGNVINATKIVLEKKKKEYPKTFLGCCDVLGIEDLINRGVNGYRSELLDAFQKLLICRDAYWQIAGQEMGLNRPWEPDWEGEGWYVIVNHRGDIVTDIQWHANAILAFPTKEMRDAFYGNIKELIEQCKELL